MAGSDKVSDFAAAQLRDAKLSALAELAAGAGHEINNPLATIVGRAQLLLREEPDPERRRALATIIGQAHRIRDMIGDLMLFARPPEPQPELLDLNDVVEAVIAKFTGDFEERGCRVRFDRTGHVPILADEVQLCIVISALVSNALNALSAGGEVVISAERDEQDGRAGAVLTVSDHGVGLSETDREHLFDPFYSGRQAGRGLGFGLPKCWRIVTNHGGQIDATSSPKGETRFVVRWLAELEKSAGPD